MPDQVDTVAVPRVLQNIAEEAGVFLSQVSYESIEQNYLDALSDEGGVYPIPHLFSMTVDGTYVQIKQLLRLLEQNEFPLEVHLLSLRSDDEGGFLTAELSIVTYASSLPAESKFEDQ